MKNPIYNTSAYTLDEILEMLVNAESEVFELASDNPDNAELDNARIAARTAMESFARAIGRIK